MKTQSIVNVLPFISLAVAIAGITLSVLGFYLAVDAIAFTLPPWDYCGFSYNHIGTSFTCIGFDVEPIIIK